MDKSPERMVTKQPQQGPCEEAWQGAVVVDLQVTVNSGSRQLQRCWQAGGWPQVTVLQVQGPRDRIQCPMFEESLSGSTEQLKAP